MEIRLGAVNLVLIPLLIAPSFVAIVVVLCVEKGVNHGRSDRVLGAIIGMTPAALPRMSSDYLLKTGST
jgi:hypothetical protein